MPGKKPLFYFFNYLLQSPTSTPRATGAALYLISNIEELVDEYSLHTVYQSGDWVRVVLRKEDNCTVTFELSEDRLAFFEPYSNHPSAVFSLNDVHYRGGTDRKILAVMESVCLNFYPHW